MNCANSTFISSTFWSERSGPTAALATIKELKKINPYNKINKKGIQISKIWKNLSKKYQLPITVFSIPSLIAFKFHSRNHENYKKLITREMLKYGILASTRVYVSIAHTREIIKKYSFYLDLVFKKIKKYENLKKKNKIKY